MKPAVMPIDGEWADYGAQSGHRLLSDNRCRYMAQSVLTGLPMRDAGPAPILPADQAADVLRWAGIPH